MALLARNRLGLIVALIVGVALLHPSAAARKRERSGGRAVAHRAGGVRVNRPEVTHRGPAARLYRLGTGIEAGEPTLGVTKTNNAFYTAFQTNTRIEVMRSTNGGRKWEMVSPKLPNGRNAQVISFDPYLWVDEKTSRVFTIDLMVACSWFSYSDDEGESWTTNPLACGVPVNDHQSLFGGPPAVSPTTVYPSIVYYCFNNLGASVCSKSLDGGLSFVPTGSPAFVGYTPASEGDERVPGFCGGLHGHGHVGSDGIVYLPRGYCGQPWLAISSNEGATWTRVQVADNGMSHHEAGVATDKKGNIYYTWVADDRLPYLAISRDGGESWSKPAMIAPPGVNEGNLPGIDVGGVGKLAIVYMGTTNSPGRPFPTPTPPPDRPICDTQLPCPDPPEYKKTTWNGYMTITDNALSKRPLFYSATVNHPKDPLKRGTCGPGRCGSTILDFLDIVVSPRGRVWAAFVDACTLACEEPGGQDGGNEAVVGRLVSGPKLK